MVFPTPPFPVIAKIMVIFFRGRMRDRHTRSCPAPALCPMSAYFELPAKAGAPIFWRNFLLVWCNILNTNSASATGREPVPQDGVTRA